MLSQRVIEEAEHAGRQCGVGSIQPQLRFDDGDEALLEIFQGEHHRGVLLSPTYIGPSVSRAHNTGHTHHRRVSLRVLLP